MVVVEVEVEVHLKVVGAVVVVHLMVVEEEEVCLTVVAVAGVRS